MLAVTGITMFVERYTALMRTLDIPARTAVCYMYYSTCGSSNNRRVLMDCISKGDGTPAQPEDLYCSDNMGRYRQSVPAFIYNTAVFPPYGDTIHHWCIETYDPVKHVSLITDSKEEILNYINNIFALHFVPLPDTLQ